MEFSEESPIGKVKIEMTPLSERGMRTFTVNAKAYGDGKLFASQDWVKPEDVAKAKKYVAGENGYGESQRILGFKFIDKNGRECFLIGDGHHRAAAAIVEGRDLEYEIDADLGILPEEILKDPKLAAQKLAILGVKGLWPFQAFMRKFTEVKFDSNGKVK